jgi:hypothetical protein
MTVGQSSRNPSPPESFRSMAPSPHPAAHHTPPGSQVQIAGEPPAWAALSKGTILTSGGLMLSCFRTIVLQAFAVSAFRVRNFRKTISLDSNIKRQALL